MFCLLFLGNLRASVDLQPRIVSGNNATAKEISYIASLRYSVSDDHFCGGVLISKLNVLTAAHCLFKRRHAPESVYVALGVQNQFNQGIRKNIKRIIIHPGFNFSVMKNDISIVTFYKSVSFTDFMQPIRLPTTNVPENVDLTAAASGWGLIVRKCTKHNLKYIYQ